MNNIRCMIVDDEPDAVTLLQLCLKELYPHFRIVGTYSNWKDAFHSLSEHDTDILFTDICMPEKSGMDLLKMLPVIESEIIFTTAYSEYALPAFQFSPAGYLLKPIVDTELVTVVHKAMERIKYKNLAKHSHHDKIGIHNNKGIDYIATDSIIYLESFNKCTRVFTTAGEYTSSYYLGMFKTLLDDTFYQVHRSFIVNLNAIVRYESSGVIIMSNKKEIPVARSVKEQFLSLFNVIANNKNV
jgi:two-component system LytT family response regulator